MGQAATRENDPDLADDADSGNVDGLGVEQQVVRPNAGGTEPGPEIPPQRAYPDRERHPPGPRYADITWHCRVEQDEDEPRIGSYKDSDQYHDGWAFRDVEH